MAIAVNKVILVGNLGKDPEIRSLESGIKVATFSIATTERYKDKEGNQQEQTEWHRIVAWRYLAELAEKYIKKGSKIYIEGKLSTRSYEQDGVQKYTTEVVAREIIMMSRGEGSGSYNAPPAPSEEPMQQANNNTTTQKTKLDGDLQAGSDDVDDLPF